MSKFYVLIKKKNNGVFYLNIFIYLNLNYMKSSNIKTLFPLVENNKRFLLACEDVSALNDFSFNCENPPIAGAEEKIYVMNWQDWLDAGTKTYNLTNSQILEDLVLDTGAQAIAITGTKSFTKTNYESAKSDVGTPNYPVAFQINIEATAAGRKAEAVLNNAKCVLIYEKRYKGTNQVEAFEVVGHTSPIECTSAFDTTTNAGTIVLNFAHPDGMPDSKPPLVFYDGVSYASTKIIIEALLTPAP